MLYHLLAPMSGVTDASFRALAHGLGAGFVVSEMIASQAMIRLSRQSLHMARNCAEEQPMAVQLAGCEARWMAEGARIAEANGAAIIDINMGCPARHVTGGESGSALMRNLSARGLL